MTKTEKRTAWLPQWVSCLIYAFLIILMTYPLVKHFDGLLGGADTDILNVYWGNWWVRTALTTGQNPYMTMHLIYPVGFDLTTFAFSPFLALLGIPLVWIMPPIAAYNVLVWVTIFLCCVAMDGLVRYLTGHPWAALVAGMAFGFAPTLAGDRAAHLNLALVAWIPWAALFLTRLMREARIRDAVLLAVVIGLSFLTRLQVGALALIFCGVYWPVLALVERRRWHRWAGRRLLLAGLLTLLFLSPLLIHAWQLLRQPGGENLVRQGTATAADLLSYLVPPPQHPLFGPWTEEIYDQRFPSNVSFYWTFLGLVPLFLSLYAVVSRPREALPWLVVGLFFFALALGPSLRFNGKAYEGIKLPYYVAQGLLSTIGFERPNRFNLAVVPALAVLVGLACAQISARLGKSWPLSFLAIMILFEFLVVPVTLLPPPTHSPFYDQMAADGEEYALVDLPLTRPAGEVHRYYQTIHHKPIVGGWDHRVPPSALAFIDGNPLLSAWRGSESQSVDLATALGKLAEANVRYIILHKDQLESFPERARGLFFILRPVYEDGTIYVLPTQAQSDRGYYIAHSFNENVKLIQPSATLSMGETRPMLSLNTCWLFGRESGAADGCRVTLAEPDGSIMEEQTALFPSSVRGLMCQDWSFKLASPVQQGSYEVSITPLSGQRPLGTFAMTQPLQVIQDEAGSSFPLLGHAFPVTFDALVEMLGYNMSTPGDDFLWIDLYWRSLADHDQGYEPFVHLLDPATGQPATTAGSGIIPKLEWSAGEVVHEQRMLLSNDVLQGQYHLAVGLHPPGEPHHRIPAFDKRSGTQWSRNQAVLDLPVLVLPVALKDAPVSQEAQIVVYTTSAEELSEEPPHRVEARFGDVARLVGYGWEPEKVVAGAKFTLTLYWVAVNGEPVDVDYTVFTHLLDNSGKVVAQHDGQPVERRRPTSTWQEGDRIIDAHPMTWQTTDYTGIATIEVGLYDLPTLERLPAYSADGKRLPHDRVILGSVEVQSEVQE